MINVRFPRLLPATGRYLLTEGDSAFALYTHLTDQGWLVLTTDKAHSGYATITRVDSSQIAGTFYFDAPDGNNISHIRLGAFNVPIQSPQAYGSRAHSPQELATK